MKKMIRQVSTKRHDMNDNEKTHNDKENKLVFSNKMPNLSIKLSDFNSQKNAMN